MKKYLLLVMSVVILVLIVYVYQTNQYSTDSQKIIENNINERKFNMATKMRVQINNYNFTATLESNDATKELIEMMKKAPVELKLEDYSGFEKVGPLGKSLTRSDHQTTTNKGDIVLYNGNNIVLFYGSNSWSYTRIAKIDDTTNLEKALGKGNETVIFKIIDEI